MGLFWTCITLTFVSFRLKGASRSRFVSQRTTKRGQKKRMITKIQWKWNTGPPQPWRMTPLKRLLFSLGANSEFNRDTRLQQNWGSSSRLLWRWWREETARWNKTHRVQRSRCRCSPIGPCWFGLSQRASSGEDDTDEDLTAEDQVTDVHVNTKPTGARRWKEETSEIVRHPNPPSDRFTLCRKWLRVHLLNSTNKCRKFRNFVTTFFHLSLFLLFLIIFPSFLFTAKSSWIAPCFLLLFSLPSTSFGLFFP